MLYTTILSFSANAKSVDVSRVRNFTQTNPNDMVIHMTNSDHELTTVLSVDEARKMALAVLFQCDEQEKMIREAKS
jgi:hypothetical protein